MLNTGESGEDVSLAGVQLVANDCLSMGRRLIPFCGRNGLGVARSTVLRFGWTISKNTQCNRWYILFLRLRHLRASSRELLSVIAVAVAIPYCLCESS